MSAKCIIAIRAPEYQTYDNLDQFIALADSQTGPFDSNPIGDGTLGTTRDLAVALRTLHMICRRQNRDGTINGSGVPGFITGETEGALSRRYRVENKLAAKFPDLATTIWGIELIALIQSEYGISAVTRMSSPITSSIGAGAVA